MTEQGSLSVVRGSPLAFTAYLEGEASTPVSGISGAEAVSGSLGRGDGTPSVVALSAQWDADAAAPAVVLALSAADSAALAPGQYRSYLTVGESTRAIGWITVLPGVGGEDRPATYLDAAEWRKLARPMLATLDATQDDGSVEAALGQAREDLDGEIAERYAAGWQADAAGAADARERMAGWLAADALRVTPQVKRYCSFRAAWYLLAFSVGTKDSSLSLARVRDNCGDAAEESLRGLVAYIAAGGRPVRIPLRGQLRLER